MFGKVKGLSCIFMRVSEGKRPPSGLWRQPEMTENPADVPSAGIWAKKEGCKKPPTYSIYQRWIYLSKASCAKRTKSTLDTNLTRKVWVVSHLAESHPECYIIIRKGDTRCTTRLPEGSTIKESNPQKERLTNDVR